MARNHDTTAHHNGKLYHTCRQFITAGETNSFLESNPEYGLLYEYPIFTVAKNDEKGEPYTHDLNRFKKHATSFSDDRLHNGELSLYFDNEEDYKLTIQHLMQSTYAAGVRAFKSPKDAPKQLQYTIFIEKKMDYFAEKPQALAAGKVLDQLAIAYLYCGYYSGGEVVFCTRATWPLQVINRRIARAGASERVKVEEHPLTNDATFYYSMKVTEGA